MPIKITIDFTESEWEDKDHPTGITNEAYERLTAALGWLGEIQDVKKVAND